MVLLICGKVLPERERMSSKPYFGIADITLASVFCALWVALSLTLGRVSFALTGLPVLHDFAVFFTLLLVVWATGKFGTATFVAIVGSAILFVIGLPPLNLITLGFAASALVFDGLMSLNRHKLTEKPFSLVVAALSTMISAYLAGVVIGALVINRPLDWAVTVWGGWHLVGGVITLAVTLPVIGALEKANVRRIRSA